MEDVKAYYHLKSGCYDKVFVTLYSKVYDETTWKYSEPYVHQILMRSEKTIAPYIKAEA